MSLICSATFAQNVKLYNGETLVGEYKISEFNRVTFSNDNTDSLSRGTICNPEYIHNATTEDLEVDVQYEHINTATMLSETVSSHQYVKNYKHQCSS